MFTHSRSVGSVGASGCRGYNVGSFYGGRSAVGLLLSSVFKHCSAKMGGGRFYCRLFGVARNCLSSFRRERSRVCQQRTTFAASGVCWILNSLLTAFRQRRFSLFLFHKKSKSEVGFRIRYRLVFALCGNGECLQ